MTYYVAASGAEVIGAGTMGWASGLGAAGYIQPAVAKITRNILDRFTGATGAADPANAPWRALDNLPRVAGEWSPSVTTVVKDGLMGPSGVAVNAAGDIFIADAPQNSIFKVVNGQLQLFAGGRDGTDDGPGLQARFRWPSGLYAAPDGRLFVADTDNHTIRAIAPDGTVSTFAGMPTRGGGYLDGPATTALFFRPVAVTGLNDALLVADMHNCMVRQIAADGSVTSFAGSTLGFADGPALSAQLNNPSGLAVGPDGSVYVLDTYNQAIRRIKDGEVSTLVGGDGIIGLVDGPGTAARIGAQAGMTWSRGQLFISDVASARIRAITVGDDKPSTRVTTFAGSGRLALEDGTGDAAAFAAPMALAASGDGSIWLADGGNRALRRLAPAR
jgi:DNA-binding beta-propeller fold protein YncE